MQDRERRRYKDASYGTFEKTRRYQMVGGLMKVCSKLDDLLTSQKTLLVQEYQLHEGQLDLIDSALSETKSDDSERARAYLRTLRNESITKRD